MSHTQACLLFTQSNVQAAHPLLVMLWVVTAHGKAEKSGQDHPMEMCPSLSREGVSVSPSVGSFTHRLNQVQALGQCMFEETAYSSWCSVPWNLALVRGPES